MNDTYLISLNVKQIHLHKTIFLIQFKSPIILYLKFLLFIFLMTKIIYLGQKNQATEKCICIRGNFYVVTSHPASSQDKPIAIFDLLWLRIPIFKMRAMESSLCDLWEEKMRKPKVCLIGLFQKLASPFLFPHIDKLILITTIPLIYFCITNNHRI